ncbi:MAG: hypothetical protein KGJ06_05140 [Pseudomonadota bacterium]|nr:hypothetical protein [Pseudomonadota bacterium]
MSFENNASEEISKILEFDPDPCTFCVKAQARMEDLVIAAIQDEFLDLKKLEAFDRWSQAAHLMLGPSLAPPPKPGRWARLLGAPAELPAEPGRIPHNAALGIATMVGHVYNQMIKLTKEKKVSPMLWDEEQEQVDALIKRLEQRKTIMLAVAEKGSSGLREIYDSLKQRGSQSPVENILNRLPETGKGASL